MNLQDSFNDLPRYSSYRREHTKDCRRFQRYKIKRRILIKDANGHILTGHAHDISRQGLQIRCTKKIAYHLKSESQSSKQNSVLCEIKIALPYMNQLISCGIHCKINSFERFDDENMRIGLGFVFIDKSSQSRLNHFIDNLTL